MKKTLVMTDSNSGITQSQAKELGILVLPMPVLIDSEEYFEDITITQEKFYEMLTSNVDVSTSQPSPESVMNYWNQGLKEAESLVYIPMSSGLSGSYQTAKMLSQDYDGKVAVVNNQRISVTMRQSVYDAIELAQAGKSAQEICDILEADKFNSSIYIMVDTLTYLKKGGRLTPAVANLGQLLKIKPVLQIQGEKLDAFSVARTLNQSKNIMISAVEKDLVKRYGLSKDGEGAVIMVAHTQNYENADIFIKELKEVFPKAEFFSDPLSLSISCHIGPGSLALACAKKLKVE